MKNVLKNIILIIALAAVIVMIVAILLYDFIPSSSTVTEPNIYSADTSTTKVLSEIADSSESLDASDEDSSNINSSIVLQSYSITETDLDLYTASNSYERGKADPFEEISGSDDNESESDGTSGSTNNSKSGNRVETDDEEDENTSSSNTNNRNNNTNDNSNNDNDNINNDNKENNENNSDNNSNSKNTVSDGTLFNSTHTK